MPDSGVLISKICMPLLRTFLYIIDVFRSNDLPQDTTIQRIWQYKVRAAVSLMGGTSESRDIKGPSSQWKKHKRGMNLVLRHQQGLIYFLMTKYFPSASWDSPGERTALHLLRTLWNFLKISKAITTKTSEQGFVFFIFFFNCFLQIN